ncbi:DUF503 domain-containing protein [Desulforamulus hydrothermalis]|uniref:YlxP-like protein n=1 Tax=Desulforamulus hydrothermalis Lam5 = DSM 18033 TaxID=1121428 RepID=K8E7M4_9FIRM|nr:DUF503 domain-containing protein [Desulforamulus hydrothermalis]CCO07518.1 conserved hypothetical protein [Desulforamulus hydrothermalis Lam5 = DSM 18033]SHH16670.1 hypothetical protein SAMN02745177_01671 [Desulforamulus hydrothermalis Lam5 = DSM 18033]
MIVGLLTVELHIGGAVTLKDKRRVIKSIVERVRSRYNVSIAEVADQDLWQRATLGVAAVSTSTGHVNRMLETVLKSIQANREADLINYWMEIM